MSVAYLAFDRYELIKDLVASGMKEAQAESISSFISSSISRSSEMTDQATKSDVQIAQTQTEAKIVNLDAKIDRVYAELDTKIDRVASELDSKIDRVTIELGSKMIQLESKFDKKVAEIEGILKLHSWMLGVIVAGIIAILIRSFFSS